MIINENHGVFLNWLIDLKLKDDTICDYVTKHENFKMLEYLINHGFRYSKTAGIIYRLHQELAEIKTQIHKS